MQEARKNWALRTMVFILALTLVSTCLLGGTLAKYVTSGSGSDTARVAKWGVVITPSAGDGLFLTDYIAHDSSYTLGATVSASTEVMAPGTDGVFAGFDISGIPEVACRITINVDTAASKLTGWKVDGGFSYEPVLWTFVDGVNDVYYGSFDDLLAALALFSLDCAPGTDLSSIGGFSISWEWPFTSGNDVEDTYLGDHAEDNTITLVFDIIVTQID